MKPFVVVASDVRVEAWSSMRLPFEPKGRLKDLRAELRQAIRSMRAVDGRALHGIYSSDDPSLVDAENVLFYNIGTDWFSHLATTGISFERRHATIALPTELERSPFVHHVSYQLQPAASPWHATPDEQLLVGWAVELRDDADPATATAWWYAARPTISGPDRARAARFTMDVRLTPRRGTRPNLPALIKPIFDGVIVILASRVNDRPENVQKLLTEGPAPLGPRVILRPWGKPPKRSFQWDPADDLCVAGRLLLNEDAGERMAVGGWLFEV